MFTLQKLCPITSVDFFYNVSYETLRIYVGDEMGFVRVQDATEIIHLQNIKPIYEVWDQKKRNPY